MEVNGSYTPEISERIANEVRNQLHEIVEAVKSEMSHIKEITNILKELLSRSREDIDQKRA